MKQNSKAVAHDGELYLMTADKKAAVLYDSLRGTFSPEQDMQVFFKWGNFIELDPPMTLDQIKELSSDY